MCLGVPGLIVELYDDRGVQMADVDFGGVRRPVCMAYTPDAAVGDYAIVHAGFAIARLDEAAAQESLALYREMDAGEEEPSR